MTKRTGMKRLTGYSRGGGVRGAIEAKGVRGRTERKRGDRGQRSDEKDRNETRTTGDLKVERLCVVL